MPASEREQMGILLVCTQKVTYLLNRCAIYEALYRKDGSVGQALDNLECALAELYSIMLRLIIVTCDLQNTSVANRVIQATFDTSQLSGLLDTCNKMEQRVASEADNRQRVNDNERSEVALAWLAALDQPIARIDRNVENLLEIMAENEKYRVLD